ncbi:MAG: type II toxin-antitoxin system RelE/ParE family toxin [Chthoniobacter sp.]|nr:type II toxin-antitoxin system RelE/ParE family toxin [Chthoniobacter sp.]
MKFTVRVTDAVILDQIEAARWYEWQREGLGRDFSERVTDALRRLESEALLHPVRFADVRRAALQRFAAYGLFYTFRESEVTVFAVVHGARNPSWVRRRRQHLG